MKTGKSSTGRGRRVHGGIGAVVVAATLALGAVATGCGGGNSTDTDGKSGGAGGTSGSSGTGGTSGHDSGAGGSSATGGSGGSGGSAGMGGGAGAAGTGGGAGAAGTGGAAGMAGSAGAAGTGGGTGGAAGAAGTGGTAGTGGSGWPLECSACHGGPINPAPPVDLNGQSDTANPGVGAHLSHLGTSNWHHDVQCTECHIVPTVAGWDPATPSHLNGTDDLVWGPLAQQGTYNSGTSSCSATYCHGGTLKPDVPGQTSNRQPTWTTVDGSQVSCGTSCHTLPPGGGHSASTACQACHPAVVTSFSAGNPPIVVWADPSLHIDGKVDAIGLTCTSCHGDQATGNPAPPLGTNGETATTQPAVGAHTQHLSASTWHRQGLCTDCHVLPGSTGHSNGTTDFDWGGPSNTGNPGPSYTAANTTCSNTYCHGTTLEGPNAGGTVHRTPDWTMVNNTQDSCGNTCHTNPPGGAHPAANSCEMCHNQVISSYVPGNPPQATWANAALHVDGQVQVANLSCTSCHGDPTTSNPAPPQGTHGETATSDPAVGAHAQHLSTSTWHRQGQCTDCHTYPGSVGHSNGTTDFDWGGPSNTGNPGPSYAASNTTCSNTYCHGTTLEGAKPGGTVARIPDWTLVNNTQDSCGNTCHTNPPGGTHVAHADCTICHAEVISAYNPGTMAATWAAAAKHVNGTVESAPYHKLPQWESPKGQSEHHGSTYFIGNQQKDEHGTACSDCHGVNLDGGTVGVSCNNTSCHGGNWRSCTFCHGTQPGQINPPVGVAGESTTNTLSVGRHVAHLSAGATHVAYACNTCHQVPATDNISHAIEYVPSASLATPGHHGDVLFSGAASNMTFNVNGTQGNPVTARGTCLLACHSDGRGNPPNVTPYWAGGTWNTGNCASCHDASPNTGRHGKHRTEAGCVTCHPAVPGAGHVNGVRDVRATIVGIGPGGGGVTTTPPGGPCGANRWTCNGSCHGNNGTENHQNDCW